MFWALLLAGCPAEMLGVELPAAGVAALSEMDLQRDTRMLSEVTGDDRLERLHRRFEEMRLKPAFGRDWRDGDVSCGVRAGRGEGAVLIVAVDDGATVQGGAVPAAALISLAKVTDLAETSAHAWIYCDAPESALAGLTAKPPLPIDAGLVMGPLSDGPFEVQRDSMVRVATPSADLTATADGLDYRALRDRTEALVRLSREIAP